MRFTLTVWPGTRQRPDISLQPWEGRPNALRGSLRATADGQEYDLPAAEAHPDLGEPDEVGEWVAFSGPGEHDEVAEWVGPSDADVTRPHLWLDGYSTLGFDGSLSFLAVLRTSPETVEHVDVTFTVDELDLELVWSIDLEPIYSPPADVAETAAEVSARSRWARPLLFENMETAQSDLAVGRLDSFHLARQVLSFRQTIWAHRDTLGLLASGGTELWFERDTGPVGIFSATVGGKTSTGNNGRSASSRLMMSGASVSLDYVQVDWQLGLTGLAKASYRTQPVLFQLIDPYSQVDLTWSMLLSQAE